MTLHVRNLSVSIGGKQILNDVSLALKTGERLGVIGASGSGKTALVLAISGLLPEGATVTGEVELDGTDLLTLSEPEIAAIRGDQIGFIFQEPKSALNPIQLLGRQITESLNIHYQLSRAQREEAAHRLALRVGLSNPEAILRSYPHQVSGGQRQRIAIAAAIAASPHILIADEPTTALDVTVQSEILTLLRDLSETERMGMLFITHDLAVLSQVAQNALVLDRGEVVERGPVSEIIGSPQHEITVALVAAARAAQLPHSEQGGAK